MEYIFNSKWIIRLKTKRIFLFIKNKWFLSIIIHYSAITVIYEHFSLTSAVHLRLTFAWPLANTIRLFPLSSGTWPPVPDRRGLCPLANRLPCDRSRAQRIPLAPYSPARANEHRVIIKNRKQRTGVKMVFLFIYLFIFVHNHFVLRPMHAVVGALVHRVLVHPLLVQTGVGHHTRQHDRPVIAEPALFAELPSALTVRVVHFHRPRLCATQRRATWERY